MKKGYIGVATDRALAFFKMSGGCGGCSIREDAFKGSAVFRGSAVSNIYSISFFLD